MKTPEHPASQQRLVLLAILAVIVGLMIGSTDDVRPGLSLTMVVTLFAFGCALVLLGLFGLARVLRQHELWRDHRSRQDEVN